MQAGSRPRPTAGLELWSWLFMRYSGLVLVFLALGHLAVMHLVNSVDDVNYDFVAERYRNILWRGYDLVMVVLAMIHGMNGARILIDDYIHNKLWHKLSLGALYFVCGSVLILGVYAAIFFPEDTILY